MGRGDVDSESPFHRNNHREEFQSFLDLVLAGVDKLSDPPGGLMSGIQELTER